MSDCCPLCGSHLRFDGEVRIEEPYVVRNGKAVKLSRREMAFFKCLHAAHGRVVSSGHIMDHVYGLDGDEPNDKILSIYVMRLRRKFKGTGLFVVNEWGRGYALGVEK